MKLKDYQSLCKLNQRIIVSKDKKNSQKHIAYNNDRDEVYQYNVDGNIIREGIRCDFLLMNKTKQHIYYIELKGSDIVHALAQIDATEKALKQRFKEEISSCNKVSYRIVLNRLGSPRTYSHEARAFLKKHLGDLKYGERVYSDVI